MEHFSEKNNEKLVIELFKKLKIKGYSDKEIYELVKKFENFLSIKKTEYSSENIYVPISVFDNDELSCLETIVKYLKENKLFNYNEISIILNRSPSSIGITYKNSKKKKLDFLKTESAKYIPIDIIKNRHLSVLENLVYYLKGEGEKYSEIAQSLHRDYKTIWTVYNRALKKLKGDNHE